MSTQYTTLRFSILTLVLVFSIDAEKILEDREQSLMGDETEIIKLKPYEETTEDASSEDENEPGKLLIYNI